VAQDKASERQVHLHTSQPHTNYQSKVMELILSIIGIFLYKSSILRKTTNNQRRESKMAKTLQQIIKKQKNLEIIKKKAHKESMNEKAEKLVYKMYLAEQHNKRYRITPYEADDILCLRMHLKWLYEMIDVYDEILSVKKHLFKSDEYVFGKYCVFKKKINQQPTETNNV
jgi:hypothetical protein